ncbi:MAG TPA: cellulase family glycosylhydrolase [Acidobacteriaceae bacterium]|nr:cellulase family glycosylhydrolase [Acidobacteriaceae bacterium]
MDRRNFIATGLGAAGYLAARHGAMAEGRRDTAAAQAERGRARIDVHRFGVNYTPSHNWWFCWNDWKTDPIERDLDAIASLGADHMRILLIWPYFQPNGTWVSGAHLNRLGQLLTLMEARKLDAVVTVFTGQLSGQFFLPPFHTARSGFYTDPAMWKAEALFVRELARTTNAHGNVIGFDLGNELNTCWTAEPEQGDAWMARMFALMDEAAPGRLHVNGVDQQPWFERTTFSPEALAARPLPVIHCYPWWTGALKYGGAMDPPSTRLVAAMATLARAYMKDQQRPVWAEEFNTCIAALSESQQAEWLQTTVLSAKDAGVNWFTYWDSHDLNRKFAFNQVEYTLGLLTNDGRVKEQGRMFRELARTYGGKPVEISQAAVPAPPAERSTEAAWQWMLDWMGWKPKA